MRYSLTLAMIGLIAATTLAAAQTSPGDRPAGGEQSRPNATQDQTSGQRKGTDEENRHNPGTARQELRKPAPGGASDNPQQAPQR